MERHTTPYQPRYDRLSPMMLRALIQAHEQIGMYEGLYGRSEHESTGETSISVSTRISLLALKAELEARKGEE